MTAAMRLRQLPMVAGPSGTWSTMILPEFCGSRPSMTRSNVVLPQPDAPVMATKAPLGMSSERSLKIGGSVGP